MSYPVTFEADYVEQHSRLTSFFRLLLAIPLFIWAYFYGIVASIAIWRCGRSIWRIVCSTMRCDS